ncbi:MAG: hypothetical protein CL551_02665 [Alcanivorax sp.]|nr:hypothetical protein [Alcanivorax sp.]MBI53267.1 hypothetical protein [Alcanivorax sp.]HCE40448.1 hypothetical protein [Alcanivorax sp.]|tara:strand:+ start:1951 stop:2358 length:408 start_codon:yes stop_codon:yes gene_type:complete
MTKQYDEQDGFRRKTGERDFNIRPVGGRASQPESAVPRASGWTLLDQVAGGESGDSASRPQIQVREEPAPLAMPAQQAVAEPARPRFRSLLSGAAAEPSRETVEDAYNGTPLKALLRRIAERQAVNRPSGFDAWR